MPAALLISNVYFNNSASDSDCIENNNLVIYKTTSKYHGIEWSWLNLKICLEGLRKCNHDAMCADRYSNSGLSEYKSEALMLKPAALWVA
jgi:hypothetical protein